MKRATKLAAILGAALTLGVVSSHAQPYGPGPGMGWGPGAGPGMHDQGYGPGAGPRMHGMGHGPGSGPGMRGMGNGTWGPISPEEHLAVLKTRLGITANQESAWKAFADQAKQQAEKRKALFAKQQETRPASAPDALAQRAEFMKQRAGEMEAHAAALKNLYAALTPEQKAIADRQFAGFGPRHAGYGPGFGGGRFR